MRRLRSLLLQVQQAFWLWKCPSQLRGKHSLDSFPVYSNEQGAILHLETAIQGNHMRRISSSFLFSRVSRSVNNKDFAKLSIRW